MTALLYVVPTWPVEEWAGEMRGQAPDLDVRIWPDGVGLPSDISYVVAWRPPANVLKGFPNLRAIFSPGAGVDDLVLEDATLPSDVPIVRIKDPELTMRMTEYVVGQVLYHHRRMRRMEENQRRKIWDPFPTHAASAISVGVMGVGVLGTDAALKLASLGFKVAGWSRSRKIIPGIDCFAGSRQLDAFLARTDILVCLLPNTTDTQGLINRDLIAKLSRRGPFGAPILINVGRGALQVEGDILSALDAGELHWAVLDVFQTEPLPEYSPLWTHPRATVTPHCAADPGPGTITACILRQIRRCQRGQTLENVVDRSRGY